MEIIINKKDIKVLSENYSEYEEDDVVSILSAVCREIDENEIARFSIFLSNWDPRFDKVNFRCDFSSIVTELDSLLEFLKNKTGTFILHFYELDRRVHFKFINEDLEFNISTSVNNDILFNGIIDADSLDRKVRDVLGNFKMLLVKYFPKAFKEFIKTGYIFSI
jgi:hypothetical protein